jgi:hypothetical protein
MTYQRDPAWGAGNRLQCNTHFRTPFVGEWDRKVSRCEQWW